VAAVPGSGEDWAFLSCGTWSVLGALTDKPVTSPEVFAANFCNELTLKSPFLCRNIMGLWILQRCQAAWQRRGRAYPYDELVRMAAEAPENGALINPSEESFLAPPDMIEALHEYCRRTGQSAPQGAGEVARCVLDSLSLSYRHALEALSRILRRRFRTLYVVGGGSLNRFLCQRTADATDLTVMAGPVEATVMGNILVQAWSRGVLSSPSQARDVARRSTEFQQYQPRPTAAREDRYEKYLQLLNWK
jgi:rhamnulokinase